MDTATSCRVWGLGIEERRIKQMERNMEHDLDIGFMQRFIGTVLGGLKPEPPFYHTVLDQNSILGIV